MGELREVEAMLGDQCSHGIKWGDECRECDLIAARETVRHFGLMVDEARAKIVALSNQCDGCRVGAPMSPYGGDIHHMPDGGFMACTKDRYVDAGEVKI